MFNSLVVRLPDSSIFWQFWLFFVFKFVVVLLLVVQGSEAYLPVPPFWPEILAIKHLVMCLLTIIYLWKNVYLNSLPIFELKCLILIVVEF